jgi:two-component sensor histidine kinase
MTNAAKYGALSNADGRIDIVWTLEGPENQSLLTFEWRESGGPAVVDPTRTGFGSRLLRSSLKTYGEVHLEYRPSGLVVEACFHLSKVQYRDELNQLSNGDSPSQAPD